MESFGRNGRNCGAAILELHGLVFAEFDGASAFIEIEWVAFLILSRSRLPNILYCM